MSSNDEEASGQPGSTDRSIGRPSEWREGRYERSGDPKKESVVRKPGELPPDTTSAPVTRRDYESLESRLRRRSVDYLARIATGRR